MEIRETKITVEQVGSRDSWRAFCDDETNGMGGSYAANPLVALYGALFRLGDPEQNEKWEREFVQHLKSKRLL